LLREATIELLENACRHAVPGTAIALSAYPTGDEAHISVASSGPWVCRSFAGLPESMGAAWSTAEWATPISSSSSSPCRPDQRFPDTTDRMTVA
jgi:hypothetical protein